MTNKLRVLTYEQLARMIKKEVKQDYDAVVCFSGREGAAKSNNSILLGAELSKLMRKQFDLNKNIIYMPRPENIKKKFNNLNPGQVMIMDEAIKVLYKLNWFDNLQKSLNELFATERKQNKITIINIPRFSDLNDYFRNHRVRWWLYMLDRDDECSIGVLYRYIDNEFATSGWDMKEGKKISQNNVGTGWRHKHPNFYGYVLFPKLPQDVYDKYIELCQLAKIENDKLEESMKEKESLNENKGGKFDPYKWKEKLEQLEKEGVLNHPLEKLTGKSIRAVIQKEYNVRLNQTQMYEVRNIIKHGL